jgi:uncharacterized membrane protein YkgB
MEGSAPLRPAGAGRLVTAVRFADLALLAAALVVFVLAGLPIAGYAAIAAVWLLGLWVEHYAERRAARELSGGNRRDAMGWVAATSLGRVWVIVLTVLLVGLLVDREAGLAAAVLAAILFTVHFACRLIARAMTPPEKRL